GPRGRRDPDRTSLRAARDGPAGRAGDGARVARALQHAGGPRPAGRGAAPRARGVRVMSQLNELYQEVILDHNRRPRNFRVIDPATRTQEGYNPLCGDRLTLY